MIVHNPVVYTDTACPYKLDMEHLRPANLLQIFLHLILFFGDPALLSPAFEFGKTLGAAIVHNQGRLRH